jgi:hypothetical protein
VASEFHRTLPPDFTSLGRFIAHCCINVDASGADAGIARLIMTYFGGFTDSSVRLLGTPAYGKDDDSLPACSYCAKEYSEAKGGGVKLCCGNVYYCGDGDCRKNGLKRHASVCVSDEAVKRRTAVAAVEEVKRKESRREEDKAAAAAASLLAELDLEEENDSKKKSGGGQDSKKEKKKKKKMKMKKKKKKNAKGGGKSRKKKCSRGRAGYRARWCVC